MNISKRLKAVAGLITEGNIIADIGTDHGYIPIYMVTERNTPYAYAMDVNMGPLKRAKDNIDAYGVTDKVETRLSDGLKGLQPGLAGSIVIAGMGGLLICKILTEGMQTAKSAEELILSPHSDVDEVRVFLSKNHFETVDEGMVLDEGKYYFVIKAVPTDAECETPDDLERFFGRHLLMKKDPVFTDYLKNEVVKKEEILRKLREYSSDTERLREVEEELARIRKGLEICESK